MTYSRAVRTTIGPGCLTAVFGMGTGVTNQVWSPERRLETRHTKMMNAITRAPVSGMSIGSDKSCSLKILHDPWVGFSWHQPRRLSSCANAKRQARPIKKRINAAKRLAVSTGQLSTLPYLHTRPIDLVVFQEPTFPKEPETSSCGGFHAYMPSAFILAVRGYPALP